MERSNDRMAWYNSLPKRKQRLLDKWEELGLQWISGPVWGKHPHSVELESYTDAGGDMIIDLEDISNDELLEYLEDFDIDREVSIWWEDGKPGRGVPFDNQAEHVEDLEQWQAKMMDVARVSRGKARKRELSYLQDLYVERFRAAAKDLQNAGVGIRYDKKKETFDFYPKLA